MIRAAVASFFAAVLLAAALPVDGKQVGLAGMASLLLGAALTEQEHSIIFRREAVQLTGIEERLTKILGSRTGYNSQTGVWRLPGTRVLELGSVKQPEDWLEYAFQEVESGDEVDCG